MGVLPEDGARKGRYVARVLVTAKGGPLGPFLKNGTIFDQHPVQGDIDGVISSEEKSVISI